MYLKINSSVQFTNESFKDFLNKIPIIPLCQREYITERIDEFFNKIKDHYLKTNEVLYLNIINCGMLEGKIQIVDGQHRFYAYKKFSEHFPLVDFNISYIVKFCENKDQLRNFFKDLNNNYNLHSLILDDIDKSENIKNYLKTKYSKHISNSSNPQFPNINLDQLIPYLIKITLNKMDIEVIEKLNDQIKNDQLTNKEYYDKCMNKQGLFFAFLFKDVKSKRTSLPSAVRKKCWSIKFLEEYWGICEVCSSKINVDNFHTGHIQSVKDGGSNNISNLVPVCSLCNLSMSSMNLYEFKKTYF